MSGKSHKPPASGLFPYEPEDLEPHDYAVEESKTDEFISRDRKAINEALQEAYTSLEQGKSLTYRSLEELHADIMSRIKRS